MSTFKKIQDCPEGYNQKDGRAVWKERQHGANTRISSLKR